MFSSFSTMEDDDLEVLYQCFTVKDDETESNDTSDGETTDNNVPDEGDDDCEVLYERIKVPEDNKTDGVMDTEDIDVPVEIKPDDNMSDDDTSDDDWNDWTYDEVPQYRGEFVFASVDQEWHAGVIILPEDVRKDYVAPGHKYVYLINSSKVLEVARNNLVQFKTYYREFLNVTETELAVKILAKHAGVKKSEIAEWAEMGFPEIELYCNRPLPYEVLKKTNPFLYGGLESSEEE